MFIRAAAGTLAIGNAAPVNLPFAVQADEAEAAPAGTPVHAATRLASSRPRSAVDVDAGQLRSAIRLKIGKNGELPCDSGEWANSSLFGPGARLVAALGLDRASSLGSAVATALADALGDTPTGGAQSSAFGSVFGNSPFTSGVSGFGDPRGGGAGSAGGTSGGGAVIGGGTGIGGESTPGGGSTTLPIEPIQPGNPGDGGDHIGGNSPIRPSDPPVTGAVPEPASWATMLCGFAAIGAMLRRRKPVIAKV